MNNQNSSSIDMSSSGEKNMDVNDVIGVLNNQYFTVRRPEESNLNNILAYLNYDQEQQVNKEKISSKDLVINQDSAQQQALISKKSRSLSQENQLQNLNSNQYLQKLKIENAFENFQELMQFKNEHQQILNDIGFAKNPIELQLFKMKLLDNLEKILLLFNILYLIILLLSLFEYSITIISGKKLIYHISFYVIQYFVLILDSIVSYIYSNSNKFRILLQIFQFVFIVINNSIENQYFTIILLFQIYFIYVKYYSQRKYYIEYFKIVIEIELMIILISYIHFFSCILFLVSINQENSWITELELTNWSDIYAYCFYWCFTTVTTIGQNKIFINGFNEVILTTTCMTGFFMIIFQIYFVYKAKLNLSYKLYKKIEQLNNYLDQQNIKNTLKQQIYKNMIRKITEKLYFDIQEERQIQNDIPQQLLDDIKLIQFRQVLFQIPFFTQISDNCLNDIVLQLQERISLKQEILSEQGLYYCLKGKFYNVLPNGVIIERKGILKEFFGLTQLFYGNKELSTAVSNVSSKYLYLSRSQFLKIMKKYPLDYQFFRMQLELNNLDSGIECFICQTEGHDLDTCPQIHLRINKIDLISDYLKNEEMCRCQHKRQRNRSGNALFQRKLCEDVASMYQEVIDQQEDNEGQQQQQQQQQQQTQRKKSKSLNSEEISYQLQKSNSNHSLSAIQKPQGSGNNSFSTFSLFKDIAVQRKISKHQDSDKISSNSQKNNQHSNSNSFKELPIMIGQEDKVVSEQTFQTQSRNKKILTGKQTTTSITISPPAVQLQAIPSVSDMDTSNENNSLIRQYSVSSKRYSSPKKVASSKATLQTNKEFELREIQKQEFELPYSFTKYFPEHNIFNVVNGINKKFKK